MPRGVVPSAVANFANENDSPQATPIYARPIQGKYLRNMCRSTIIDNPATLGCSSDCVKAKLHIASFAHPAIRLIECVFKQFIDIDKLRSSISNKIVELDRSRRQARDSCAPVNLDQQFVGRLSPIRAIQQHKMRTANNGGRQNRHAALFQRFNDGDCSYCHQFDETIGAGRLVVDPAAMLFVQCALCLGLCLKIVMNVFLSHSGCSTSTITHNYDPKTN